MAKTSKHRKETVVRNRRNRRRNTSNHERVMIERRKALHIRLQRIALFLAVIASFIYTRYVYKH